MYQLPWWKLQMQMQVRFPRERDKLRRYAPSCYCDKIYTLWTLFLRLIFIFLALKRSFVVFVKLNYINKTITLLLINYQYMTWLYYFSMSTKIIRCWRVYWGTGQLQPQGSMSQQPRKFLLWMLGRLLWGRVRLSRLVDLNPWYLIFVRATKV